MLIPEGLAQRLVVHRAELLIRIQGVLGCFVLLALRLAQHVRALFDRAHLPARALLRACTGRETVLILGEGAHAHVGARPLEIFVLQVGPAIAELGRAFGPVEVAARIFVFVPLAIFGGPGREANMGVRVIELIAGRIALPVAPDAHMRIGALDGLVGLEERVFLLDPLAKGGILRRAATHRRDRLAVVMDGDIGDEAALDHLALDELFDQCKLLFVAQLVCKPKLQLSAEAGVLPVLHLLDIVPQAAAHIALTRLGRLTVLEQIGRGTVMGHDERLAHHVRAAGIAEPLIAAVRPLSDSAQVLARPVRRAADGGVTP